ncbi:MAG: alcohol dehydrogenase [Candidatus Lambdaproteobacteria bacterium RIFOXYD2_FULL_50_16]|uniref:Alcohol dehydrogenase n=1 Tax=Candidatus Lambdaproteobacteria bacterium RIFOXYD2_FULL_50_16 TaxID=1817772 RepID=A0A1F6GD49_9PROT|nr:MAG: alcohol dehydrogenase [Candidatus Lambdaproteobacteria bacterium RIFOXYD2_FULL_50_16]
MEDYKKTIVGPQVSLKEAIRVLEASDAAITLIADEAGRLLGTLTDGDIRRAMIRGVGLSDSVAEAMCTSPTSAPLGTEDDALKALVSGNIRHIPLLDKQGHIRGLRVRRELIRPNKKNNLVVLMVGGLGTRLRPLTNDCPKPLLPVGGRPILETIIKQFIEFGFSRFYLTVNFQGQQIKDYFGDGSNFGVQIGYVEEEQRLGTAGALSLLPETPTEPVVVMNGDLLTKANFHHLIEFINKYQAKAVMGVKEYDVQVPYGVVNLKEKDELQISGIDEKPVHRYFVNAGIYALSPEAISQIPKGEFYDMPTLFEAMLAKGEKALAFPIREYWTDIGQLDEYNRANEEFDQHFR